MLRFKILQEVSQNMEKTNFRTRPLFFSCSFLGFLLILLSTICVCSAAESDFYCLKSIKDSLQDPFNSLGSWDFRNAIEDSICHFAGIQCWHDYDNKVMNLRLSNLGLIGEFPRGIQNCTSLTGLDLSGNKLYGTIPSNISVIVEHVTTLDLGSNLFSGNIPPDIANCAYLNFLMLDNNNLRGEIPRRIGSLPRLEIFSVANNYLTGSVPSFVNVQITADSFANNSRLCGKPLKECEYSEDFEDSWIWKHIDYASFIQAFVVGLVLFYALVLVFCLFQFPTKAINKIVSLNKSKLRRKEHLSPRSDSPGDEELSSHQKVKILLAFQLFPSALLATYLLL
ncbi:probably inactive leucine-rich repeat receptor-like protein kinase At5g48380 [Lycium ferocissimum]|uniref:probably inactive leucine-rich repeat receptor-like protein kinase At5g48380 n=1 Tax=Lycium ferocissimum TaxID=112874 RepID=UPI0028157496|nr:probably inactive leucine-rich repeat receptor-like protein kinase At5g48380 [Lycium ferocissimum]